MKFKFLSVTFTLGVSVGFGLLAYGVYSSFQRKLRADKAEFHFSSTALKAPATTSGGHSPLVAPRIDDMAKVDLGRDLFNDPRLSKNNQISCASCHDFKRGGVDRLQFSVGINGKRGETNAPTVFNSALNFRQFWDGRAADLTEQASGPVHNPVEMGSSWEEVLAKLNKDKSMKARFVKVYGSEIKSEHIVDAIAEFEKTLITVDSPYDRYMNGELSAMSEQAIEGHKKFESLGCITCHQGRNIGGNMYQRLGIANDYFKERGGSFKSDLGRYNVTKKEQDKYFFRVPSLRNVELTPPYFHDGSVHELDEAVRKMARFQLGRAISEKDVSDLVAFLKALTGKTPATVEPIRGVASDQNN